MPKTTSQLPAGTANRNAVVAADNASATLTEKITLGDIASLASYKQSATTTGTTPAVMSGDSLALEVGEAWQFEIKLVARNRKTDGTKVWSIRGGIRKSFGGAVALVGSLDTQTTGSIGGGSVSVTAQPAGLTITVTGVANADVDWQATILTSEKTSTQQALVGGCTDPDVGNYNAAADFDNGTCSYSAVPSSAALEPVASEDEIESLTVTVGANSLYPAFDPAIKDYCVKTSAAYLGNASYEIVINEGTPITGTIKAGRTLQINDGVSYYYVRVLPSDVEVGDITLAPQSGYVPGYYLTAFTIAGPSSPYWYVYDHRGVPVWYAKRGAAGDVMMGLFAGNAASRVLAFYETGSKPTLRINSASVTSTPRSIVSPSPVYGAVAWENHEYLEIASPAARRGNIIATAYQDGGFYIQEISPADEIVWEWRSKDYFDNVGTGYFHLNSVDVHPTTGNMLVSLRHCSAVLCIEYATKDVLWAMTGSHSPSYGTLQAVAIPAATQNTQWLTISGEPLVDGFQYAGTRAQHDARWHASVAPLTAGNDVISVFDNQSEEIFFTSEGAGPSARGVIYEINATAGTALHRSSIFADEGTCKYQGSYCLLSEDGGYSHAIDFVTHHPCLIEYRGPIDSAKTKVFAMDLGGDHYRIIKVPLSFFRADNLRATCGCTDAGVLPSGSSGGGGGGGGTSLLLHFDGSLADSSSNSIALTANGGAAVSSAEPKFGSGSAYFDGTNDSLSADDTPLLTAGSGDFTAEAWVYPLNDTGVLGIFGKRSSGSSHLEWVVYSLNGYSYMVLSSNGSSWGHAGAGTEPITANQWSHVAFVKSGSTCTVYVNGVTSQSATMEAIHDGSGPFVIGDGGDASQGFSGYIDEVRVSKSAVYTTDFTPPTAPFTA